MCRIDPLSLARMIIGDLGLQPLLACPSRPPLIAWISRIPRSLDDYVIFCVADDRAPWSKGEFHVCGDARL